LRRAVAFAGESVVDLPDQGNKCSTMRGSQADSESQFGALKRAQMLPLLGCVSLANLLDDLIGPDIEGSDSRSIDVPGWFVRSLCVWFERGNVIQMLVDIEAECEKNVGEVSL